jgi:hypothetical protein
LKTIIDFGDMVTEKHIDSIDDRSACIFNHYRDEQGLNVHKLYGYPVSPVVNGIIANWWKAA